MLDDAGFAQPLWFEVAKSRQAPDCAREAFTAGADVIFVWGGDGTVQRCIDAVAGLDATIAILPAGTANLLAGNLGIPQSIADAVQIGLHGAAPSTPARSTVDTSRSWRAPVSTR